LTDEWLQTPPPSVIAEKELRVLAPRENGDHCSCSPWNLEKSTEEAAQIYIYGSIDIHTDRAMWMHGFISKGRAVELIICAICLMRASIYLS